MHKTFLLNILRTKKENRMIKVVVKADRTVAVSLSSKEHPKHKQQKRYAITSPDN